MNNHCTPATSERLKAAGFPQPASPAPGQWWCMGKEATYIAAASGQYFTVIRFTPGDRPEVDEYFETNYFLTLFPIGFRRCFL